MSIPSVYICRSSTKYLRRLGDKLIIKAFEKTCNTSDYSNHEVFHLRTQEIDIEPGKVTVIIGPNGCGKSTFAQVICGAEKADGRKPVVSRKLNIGYMPQHCMAIDASIERNLLLNAGRMNKKEALNRAHYLMDTFQLNELTGRTAIELSGGEMARMAMARLLMNKYDILILDEPTIAMDMMQGLACENLALQYCHETNCALLVITHGISQARRLADNCIFFHEGSLIAYGTASEILENPEDERIRRFIATFK